MCYQASTVLTMPAITVRLSCASLSTWLQQSVCRWCVSTTVGPHDFYFVKPLQNGGGYASSKPLINHAEG